jgi:diketogulonate reductase-like aldo/keto reductase
MAVYHKAWGPLAEGKFGIFTHPVLTEIGEKYGKSAAQIALKWNAQRGVSIIPKSVHDDRQKQNTSIMMCRMLLNIFYQQLLIDVDIIINNKVGN